MMKKFFKFSLMAIAILTASVAYADDNDFLIKVAKENSKWVSFVANDAQNIDLTLYGANEDILYTQKIHTAGSVIKTYDLSALPDGSYLLEMESKSKLTKYYIEIKDNNAVISQPFVTKFLRPVFTREDGMLTLDLKGTCKGAVEVQILNEYNDELYGNTFTDEAKLIKKYDVSKIYAKELTFVIRSGGQEFTETIKL
ncbi:hypothetical protein [Pedobacter sp. ASV28]|uniref:hypothetical protein n=1 Tax=Pedobacter sp. ASV28 TaxID=2795123 RepID=UPI0018EAD1EE|nr:hypothetical protein [Pedobacter sp. ASV28]